MQQYQYDDHYKGKPRKLLILMPPDGIDYRVFCDASFLGTIKPVTVNDQTTWKTEYNMLKPIAGKIGAHIEAEQKVFPSM